MCPVRRKFLVLPGMEGENASCSRDGSHARIRSLAQSDTPALSTEDGDQLYYYDDNTAAPEAGAAASNEEWDEQAVTTTPIRNAMQSSTDYNTNNFTNSTTSANTVLDMVSSRQFDYTVSDNIAEKLRVEETRAQLAAAREGMERQALKLKQEQEQKLAAKEEARSGVASAGTATKWVSSRVRAAPRFGTNTMGGRMPGKLDVQDEELFPDLATADKILEEKEKAAQTVKVPKKASLGGASWASKMVTKPAECPPKPVVAAEAKEKPKPEEIKEEPKAPPKPLIKKPLKKKDKKDLSTFKPGVS
jgi:hypothetical protein